MTIELNIPYVAFEVDRIGIGESEKLDEGAVGKSEDYKDGHECTYSFLQQGTHVLNESTPSDGETVPRGKFQYCHQPGGSAFAKSLGNSMILSKDFRFLLNLTI